MVDIIFDKDQLEPGAHCNNNKAEAFIKPK